MAKRGPKPRVAAETIRAAVMVHGSQAAAADALGLARSSVSRAMSGAAEKPFEVADLPSELPSAEELLKRRSEQFARKKDASDVRTLIPVRVKCDGPIGIAVPGDPHLDDNGTDIDLIRRHLDVLNRHESIFGVCIGDYQNNWIGRLARLYGQQSLSQAEAWVLVEWFVNAVKWLALCAGNHDLWSGDGDPIKWMAKAARVNYEANGVRLGLTLPKGRVIRLNARHDFRGRSFWNPAFGPAKAAQMGWRDHILVCGHTHVSGHQVVRDPATGLISHAMRIGSYKTYDRFAQEQGFPNHTFSVCPTFIIRPQFSDDDSRLITVCYDPDTGADFLKWLRSRKSERAA